MLQQQFQGSPKKFSQNANENHPNQMIAPMPQFYTPHPQAPIPQQIQMGPQPQMSPNYQPQIIHRYNPPPPQFINPFVYSQNSPIKVPPVHQIYHNPVPSNMIMMQNSPKPIQGRPYPR